MRPLAGLAVAVAACASPGAAFLQPAPGHAKAGTLHRGPLGFGAPLAGAKPAILPEPERRTFPLFAVVACTALLLRARVARRASGRPQASSGIRIRKPRNNAMRNSSVATYEELTTSKRYEPLVYMYTRRFARPKHKPIRMAIKGRSSGRLAKDRSKMYRVIDFARRKRGMFGVIETIEYDPYRNARICLVRYEDGEKRYILHAIGFFVGQEVIASADAPIFVGNAMPLDNVPIGTQIHNISTDVYGQGALCRAAGTSATVLSRDDKYVTFKLPSTEVRMLPKTCWCTIGKVGRPEHNLIKLGKAGKSVHLGIRPHVRGRAKNAADHPQGGGEGRSYTGYKFQRTRFGKCFWRKTRKTHRRSDSYILIRRKNKAEANNPNMR